MLDACDGDTFSTQLNLMLQTMAWRGKVSRTIRQGRAAGCAHEAPSLSKPKADGPSAGKLTPPMPDKRSNFG